jgi:hypothetical protein
MRITDETRFEVWKRDNATCHLWWKKMTQLIEHKEKILAAS